MKKYNFQFEAIRKIKDALEKKAQKEVAIIELEIEKLKNEYEEMRKEKEKFALNENRSIKVSELQFKYDYNELMDKKMVALMQHIEELYIKRDEKMEDLVLKSKEHKIFNTLDDNMKEKFLVEQNKIEAGEIDEIAISKFIRKEK